MPADLDVGLTLDDLPDEPAVAEELAGSKVVDRPEAEAVGVVVLPLRLDPRPRLLAREGGRVVPHVLRIAEDRREVV